MNAKKSREELLAEVREDLLKSDERLLADVYDEIINHDNNTRHAAKRFAALFSKNAIESSNLQHEVHMLNRRLYWLTIAVSFLTIVSTIAGCIQAYYSYASYTEDSRSRIEQGVNDKSPMSEHSSPTDK